MTKKLTKTEPGLHFTKMTGAGNDFLIFDARERGFPKFDRSLLAKALCRRTFSIGADGIVFIEKTKMAGAAFKWDFYNADGSHAEMCGNAARCVARYALERNIADRASSFETTVGVVKTRVRASGLVEVDMTRPEIIERKCPVATKEGRRLEGIYMNTGVPHFVIANANWDEKYLNQTGADLRSHKRFEETNGANITFYQPLGEKMIRTATYERGVEAVTLACGTGAVASAVAAVLEGIVGPLDVHVPGGTLHVDIAEDLSRATLAGEARFICEGSVRPEALL